jgi:hypothetical protein
MRARAAASLLVAARDERSHIESLLAAKNRRVWCSK